MCTLECKLVLSRREEWVVYEVNGFKLVKSQATFGQFYIVFLGNSV